MRYLFFSLLLFTIYSCNLSPEETLVFKKDDPKKILDQLIENASEEDLAFLQSVDHQNLVNLSTSDYALFYFPKDFSQGSGVYFYRQENKEATYYLLEGKFSDYNFISIFENYNNPEFLQKFGAIQIVKYSNINDQILRYGSYKAKEFSCNECRENDKESPEPLPGEELYRTLSGGGGTYYVNIYYNNSTQSTYSYNNSIIDLSASSYGYDHNEYATEFTNKVRGGPSPEFDTTLLASKYHKVLNHSLSKLKENKVFKCINDYIVNSPTPWMITDVVPWSGANGFVMYASDGNYEYGSIHLKVFFAINNFSKTSTVAEEFFHAVQRDSGDDRINLAREIEAKIFRGYIVYANNREGKDPFPNWQDPYGWDTMLNNNSDVTAFYDVIYSGGQMPSTIRQGLTDYIRNTFADEVYNVYHSYDPETYPTNDLNKIKGTASTNNLTDAQMTPLLNNYKGGCE